MHACMRTYVHTYMHAYMHTYIHTYIHMNSDACVHACMHVYINRVDTNSVLLLRTPSQHLLLSKLPLKCSLLSNYLSPYPLRFSLLTTPLKFPLLISSQISLLSNSLSPYPLKFSLLSNSSPHILSNFSSSQISSRIILKVPKH